jgi:hypothetical protein
MAPVREITPTRNSLDVSGSLGDNGIERYPTPKRPMR